VLLAAPDGRLAGSVSGGCVEGAAYEEIERARATGRSRVIRYGISDEEAWDVGLACGGTIDVLVEPPWRGARGAAEAPLGAGGAGLVTRCR
jgi:xanthine/CO dehydrogenase XdhC/CoxF family maturation factor